MDYLLRHVAAILASGFILLLAPPAGQASVQPPNSFWLAINESRQLFESKEYEQALRRLEHARELAQGEPQVATVALYEGIVLATLGQQHQVRAAAAFREALRLSPWEKLPTKLSSDEVEREFEEARARVFEEARARLNEDAAPLPPAAKDLSVPSPHPPLGKNFGNARNAIERYIENREYEEAFKQFENAKLLIRHEEQRVTLALYEGILSASVGEQEKARATAAFREVLMLFSEVNVPVRISPLVERDFEQLRIRVRKELDSRPSTVSVDVRVHWKATGSMLEAREGHTATLLNSGKVLVVGGEDSEGSLPEAELYNPQTRTWSSTDSMSTGRQHHTATLLSSGEVLVTGGENEGQGVLSSAELYDPGTGTWSPVGNMTTGRRYHTATLLDSGLVLITGGESPSDDKLTSAEVYDPATRQWTPTGTMANARSYHEAVALASHRVLVMGGVGASGTLSSVEEYDPASRSWSEVSGGLTVGVFEHRAALLRSGRVLVTGGDDGKAPLPNTVLFEPGTNTWTPGTSNLNIGRAAHSITVLESGEVLVVGGEGSDRKPLASAELYIPVPGTWALASSMAAPRTQHTATLLHSGEVLLVGGRNNDGAPLSSAELYQP